MKHDGSTSDEESTADNSLEGVVTVTPSNGNVFQDLGLPDSEVLQIKSHLAFRISSIIKNRRLSQAKAAAFLGIPQPKISMLRKGKLRGFSLEKLCELLNLLGCDIAITVNAPKDEYKGHLLVHDQDNE